MDIKDCIYPDCQISTALGRKDCEHSCEYEQRMKRSKPNWRYCVAAEIHGTCQFPHCDC